MKIWKEAYKTWVNTCPYIRRELFSKEEFVKWAMNLKIIPLSKKDDFYVFLVFLEECEIICPLAFAQSDQGR